MGALHDGVSSPGEAERRLMINMTAPPAAATRKMTSTIHTTLDDPDDEDDEGEEPEARATFASEVSVDPPASVVEVPEPEPGSAAMTDPLVWARTLVDGDDGSPLAATVVVGLLPAGTVVVAPGWLGGFVTVGSVGCVT